jgi:hypothetical protein
MRCAQLLGGKEVEDFRVLAALENLVSRPTGQPRRVPNATLAISFTFLIS